MLLDEGSTALVLTWLGDSANEALACLMIARGLNAAASRLGIEITKADKTLQDIEYGLIDAASEPPPPIDELLAKAENLMRQKWDHLLSPRLLRISYASLNLDIGEAMEWLNRLLKYPSGVKIHP